jgi:HD superfamily phosphohydrolase
MGDCRDKVFNDPVHGHIELDPLMVKFIDTPQFQRLRYIKQLGGAYYVYPGASHNRFEHSIGVCYLAGQMVESLKSKQKLDIDDKDVLCVKLAGLCHDLGHGPFSHLFEKVVKEFGIGDWSHEEQSLKMFDHLIAENDNVRKVMEEKLPGEDDKKFIKALIRGLETGKVATVEEHGRDQTKRFLFEIVANKRNGVDVDKFDYFARDCHHLGIPTSFDFRRYMKFVRVIEADGVLQICVRDKEVYNVYEMFHTRHMLHLRAYQHKTCSIVQEMIKEALIKANDHFEVPGTAGVKLSEVTSDLKAYTLLTDQVFQQIMSFPDPDGNLKEAKDILKRVEKRQLYKFVDQTLKPTEFDEETFCTKMPPGSGLTKKDIILMSATFDYGMKEDNPIDCMYFFRKDTPDVAEKIHREQVSKILPSTFRDVQIRVFCRKDDETSIKAAKSCFSAWSGDNDATTEQHLDTTQT